MQCNVLLCCCLQSAAYRLLGDFRKGYLGRLALEAPPSRAEVLQRKQRAEELALAGSRTHAAAAELAVAYGQPAKEQRTFEGAGEFEGW